MVAFWLRSCFNELLVPAAATQWVVICGFWWVIPYTFYFYTLHPCCLLAACLLFAACLLPACSGHSRRGLGAGLVAAGVQGIEQKAGVVVAFWPRSCFSELLVPAAAMQWLVDCGF